jgi:long-chain acyl-CoA synthetase
MNIAQNVERAAIFFPDKIAILFEDRQITYKELDQAGNRLANAFAAHGIKKGDRVALYLPNIPEFAICYLAAVKIGAIAVSVNPMLKSEELKYLLNDSGSKLICTVEELLPHVVTNDYPTVTHVLVCEGDSAGNPTLADWSNAGTIDGKSVEMNPQDPAVLLYTSGTTGFPKGATLTHGNVVSNVWATVHHAGFKRDDRLPLFLPLFHVFGQNFIMNGAFNACATLVLYRRFVPDLFLDSVGKDKVTLFFAVPTIYIALLNMDLSKYDLSSLRYEFSAAATMPREISAQWTERFGRSIYEGYGLTECSPFAAYNHDFRHKFGSVGTPVENFEVKILDEEDNEVPLGDWGEICIKGPGVMSGYWNRPEETALALRNGWLHSGDTGAMDEEGYIFIVDRVKDMINVAGFKVWPAEVEQSLYKHPAVKEIAVYGVPDPEKGEKVKAAVVLKDGVTCTKEEIITYCKEKMANYKIPHSVDFVGELPKSATGKILKRVLRDQETKG